MQLIELKNREERGAVSASFRHNDEIYYMDMSQRRQNGPCVITYWRGVPGGKILISQAERNDVGMSVRWAVRCITEYCEGLQRRMRA